MKDFYYILGVDANCTAPEIKEAYRKLSKKFHPDINQGDEYFQDRFKEINEAYETLSDLVKRSRYNSIYHQVKDTHPEEALKKSQFYNQQAENLKRKEEELKKREDKLRFSKFKSKGPGIGMAIILIALILILGDYVYQSIRESSVRKAAKAAIVETVAPKVHKIHHRKHNLKNTATADSSANKKGPAITTTVKPVLKATPVKPVPLNMPVKAIPVNYKNTDNNLAYLYVTYLKSNITGIVNMRGLDNYNASVIEKIPANSRVFVLARGDMYYKISFNNAVGYVPKWSLVVK